MSESKGGVGVREKLKGESESEVIEGDFMLQAASEARSFSEAILKPECLSA